MRRLGISAAAVALIASSLSASAATAGVSTLPEWAADAVIYEVNVRQFSDAGTFAAVEAQLPRLESLGVEILWLMPIQPISVKNRKGSLGSPYSVADYTAINPSYGTAADFQSLVDAAHSRGMKLIIDWVANHSGWDNPWVTAHKDWYTQDKNGNIIWPAGTDWDDVADLNYDNLDMRRAMIDSMKYWVSTFDIDGFRCDVAGGVPTDFWNAARVELNAVKPVFMLAENSDNLSLLQSAFSINYGWELQSLMYGVVNSGDSPEFLVDHANYQAATLPSGTASMNFITNHDENSWNGTEFERYGSAANAMAVLTYTLPGVPLIYNGQEIGFDRRLAFFEKDAIDWTSGKASSLYPALNQLKRDNSALDVGASAGAFRALSSSTSSLVAFARENGVDKVLTFVNGTGQNISPTIKAGIRAGMYRNALTNALVRVRTSTYLPLSAWGYRVLTADTTGARAVAVSALTTSRTKITLSRGRSATIPVTFTPREVTDTYLVWKSSRPSIVSVSSSGRVTARSKGSAVVTVKSVNGKLLRVSVTVR